MDTKLANQTILVTGASGGIGRALARAFGDEGAYVGLHYHANLGSVEEMAGELAHALPLQADLRDELQVDRVFAELLTARPRVDGIVVNAGVWVADPVPIQDMPLAQWQETLDADLTSAFLSCRAFLRHLAEVPRETASIVLIGSTAGLVGEEGHVDYSCAKAALVHGMTLSLKNEIVRVAPRGRVNCICPGWVATPMVRDTVRDQSVLSRVTATMALRKIARPEDVAHAAVFLTSDALAGHLSGTILPLAGGMEGRLLHPT